MAVKTRLANKSRTIREGDVFSVPEATELLGLKDHSLKREIRLKRLRASKRGGRYYLLGAWVLQWLRDGEINRQASMIGYLNDFRVMTICSLLVLPLLFFMRRQVLAR